MQAARSIAVCSSDSAGLAEPLEVQEGSGHELGTWRWCAVRPRPAGAAGGDERCAREIAVKARPHAGGRCHESRGQSRAPAQLNTRRTGAALASEQELLSQADHRWLLEGLLIETDTHGCFSPHARRALSLTLPIDGEEAG